MRRFRNGVTTFAFISLLVLGFTGSADAQRPNAREVRDLVRSLNSKIEDFREKLTYQLQSSSADRREATRVTADIRDLQEKVRAFEQNMDQRRENRDDINDILSAAVNIDGYISTSRQYRGLESDWGGVRNLVERLSANYGVTPDWTGGNNNFPDSGNVASPAPVSSRSDRFGLTGTYQLDAGRSESTADIIANTNVGSANKQDLESKLDAPEQIALDISGNQMTLASSKASPVSFVADGSEKTERQGNRTVRVRATLKDNSLTVSSLGGETDYTITFVSEDNGKSMKVTRRITTEYLKETVFAESVYNKTNAVAGLGIQPSAPADNDTYSSNDPTDVPTSTGQNPSINTKPRIGEYVIPNGTIITGALENEINTKVSQNNDRFRMTVQSPAEFRGAVIEGYISGVGRSGRVSGRSNITFNFERIKLRDGREYDFAGFLQNVKDQNGKVVLVDQEGTAKGDSQTRETAKRGGIGAGIGAIIGAIAGGGTGAAIGAIIGGGAGAGSVIVQGKGDLRLLQGSVITVQSSSPIRADQPRDK